MTLADALQYIHGMVAIGSLIVGVGLLATAAMLSAFYFTVSGRWPWQ